MRLDTSLLEDLMARARLSTREREAMRLECAGPLTDAELAAAMGCAVASVRTYRQRGRKKFRLAQEAYEREQLGRESEDLDEEDLYGIDSSFGVERFILQAITPPHHSDHGPNIGRVLTYRDWELGLDYILADEGAMHAGAMVTPRDVAYGRHFKPIGPNPYGWDTPRYPRDEK